MIVWFLLLLCNITGRGEGKEGIIALYACNEDIRYTFMRYTLYRNAVRGIRKRGAHILHHVLLL